MFLIALELLFISSVTSLTIPGAAQYTPKDNCESPAGIAAMHRDGLSAGLIKAVCGDVISLKADKFKVRSTK